MRIRFASAHYTSNKNKFPGMYKGRTRNTIPDAVFDLVDYKGGLFDGDFVRYYGAAFAEVKAMNGTLYNSSNNGQIYSMLNYMGVNNARRHIDGGIFIIGTTSDTRISNGVYTYAQKMDISVRHYRAYYRMVNNKMYVSFGFLFYDLTDSAILK